MTVKEIRLYTEWTSTGINAYILGDSKNVIEIVFKVIRVATYRMNEKN